MAEANRWTPAYIGLGSNLGDSRDTVRRALISLAEILNTRLVLESRLYISEPMGKVDQADYINAVAGVITRLSPHSLMQELLKIETAFGRLRSAERWGPRTLDLDLLAYATTVVDDDMLKIPHPGLPERNFVLYPLAEVAPTFVVPGLGSVQALAAAVSGDGIRLLE